MSDFQCLLQSRNLPHYITVSAEGRTYEAWTKRSDALASIYDAAGMTVLRWNPAKRLYEALED